MQLICVTSLLQKPSSNESTCEAEPAVNDPVLSLECLREESSNEVIFLNYIIERNNNCFSRLYIVFIYFSKLHFKINELEHTRTV